MRRVPDEATCAICGRHFDPSESRGWCPNPSCGEWQHPSFPIDDEDGQEETADDGGTEDGDDEREYTPTTPTKSCPNCGNEVRASANFCKHCATQLTGENQPQSEPEPEPDEDGIEECPDCGADLSGIPQDRLSTCPICMFDLTPVIEGEKDAGQSTTPSQGPDTQQLTECPNCGEDLTPVPEEMRTVCPGCRVDLAEGLEADTDPGQAPPPEAGHSPPTDQYQAPPPDQNQAPPPDQNQAPPPGEGTQAPPPNAVDAPPGGGHDYGQGVGPSTPIDAMDHIAGGYVQRLSEIGVRTVGDLVNADPDAVSAKTGISARRVRGWIEDAPVDTTGSPGPQDQTSPPPSDGTTGQERPNAGDETAQPPGPGGEPTPGPAHPPEEPDELDDQSTRIQRSPKSLVLTVMGQEIEVTDGTTVGKEVRKAMVDAGAPEEDAVYVHRKHIRVDVDDEDGFFLTRLGENSLTVNGETVEKGDDARIQDGDEIGFSGVVTATISIQ